jgi:hypothetical protein
LKGENGREWQKSARLSLNPRFSTKKIAENETVSFSFFTSLINSHVMKKLKCDRWNGRAARPAAGFCSSDSRSYLLTSSFWSQENFFGKTNPNFARHH